MSTQFTNSLLVQIFSTMVSSSSTKLVFFACFVLFTFSDKLVAGESDKVQLNLYYESLCPGCQRFIVDELVKIFDSDLDTITDVKLVPFGNAKVSDNLTVICQHGEEECKLNSLEACVINTLPNQKLQYNFIRCVENYTKNWESSCLKGYGDEKAINACYNSDLSKKLILGYAKQTSSLKPEHEFVPWVTLNSKPLYTNLDDLVGQVCKAYKGKTPLPKICSSSALSEWKMSKLEFSYVDETINH
ncbi:Gamma interferon inducible lysosomal thiol reductase GILT [Arabidopsis suecica]|uniref:Gamma interferon inducible lysosomal thiol reductase GILT n=1 Tax=Arabidopsis suecica TaxID=45249 RepID=A0A8T1YNU9_ARASU|nr:Gamma interferon inducible lysosomal thiol reductase GILT [Arabidopsis suecica]